MIGLDTNVLLRVFVDDAPEQVEAARSIVRRSGRDGVRICLVALMETLWTMRRKFGFGRAAIAECVTGLLDRPEFAIEDREAVESALDLFLNFRRIEFADCLIAATNARAGCETSYTFDQDASALGHFTRLETKA